MAVNKEVTFNINGVFYHRTTDSNGVASLGISLRPGEYIITTMFDGLAIGNKVSVLPTLVTKNLNMKYLDGSSFTAQTLDGQGKPLANQNVSFNVNGVFYYKVTDNNGMAKLNIRLMPGEYIIMDGFGNRASVTRTFTVKGRAAIPTLTLDAPSYALVGENYVVNVTSPN
ncbi:adhesin-like protein, partial [human gut metagenome]